jgi:hypothetical protein
MDEHAVAMAQQAIVKAFTEVDWWAIVHDEVKEGIQFLIDNIAQLGPSFRDAFRSSCELELKRREILQQNEDKSPSVLFGAKFTEEQYQSSIDAVKCLLRLGDWFEPNEADVQACRLLCEHVDILDNLQVFTEENESDADQN